MAEPERPLLAELTHQLGSLVGDLKRMAALRWELAQLELHTAVRRLRLLLVALAVFGVAALSGLPLLAVAAAAGLSNSEGSSFAWWLLIIGLGLLAVGAAGAYLAWRRFRRRFTGMEQTIEEFREDLVWLKEWSQQSDGPDESD